VRFVWAVAALVLATVMIGAGIAQRTVFQVPDVVSETLPLEGDAPFVLIDGEVLRAQPGTQTLSIDGDGEVVAAYGRTADLEQWLSPTEYLRVEASAEGEPTSDMQKATYTPAEGAEAPVLDPRGSDLWLDEFSREGTLEATLQLPEGMSVLVATDGTAPAAEQITVSWPSGLTTPWAGPLIVGGALMLLAGIVLYILALRHMRRSRGPRRKGSPGIAAPEPEAIEGGAEKGVISASPSRLRLSRGRRALLTVPALLTVGALATGCAPDAWPEFESTPTPSATESVIIPEGQGAPAVTETQADRILARIAEQTAAADEARDAAAAAVRLDGPALAERQTSYRLLASVPDETPLAPIPASPRTALLPQAYDGWPRSFLAVVEEASGSATVMTVTQQDPWSDYKLNHLAGLAPTATMNLAAPYVGAVAVLPNSPFLVLPPNQVATAYADVLDKGDASPYAELFDAASDPFRAQVAEKRAEQLSVFNQTGASTGQLTFAATPGAGEPVSLVTLDSGAIVAVTVNETDSVTPVNEDAVIKADANPRVSTLAGATQSKTGFSTVYADQLFFFVPAQGSNEPIQLLAYRSNILDAKVVN